MADHAVQTDEIAPDAEAEISEAQENPGRPESDGFVTSRFTRKKYPLPEC